MDDVERLRLTQNLAGIEDRLELREKGVALHLALDPRQVQVGALVKRLGINLGAAANKDRAIAVRFRMAKARLYSLTI